MTKKALLLGHAPITLEHIPIGAWLERADSLWYLVWTEEEENEYV